MSSWFDPFDWLIPYGRKQRRLLERGELRDAVIVGIRRRSDGDGGDRYEFALDVEGGGRAGVRQKGLDDVMRLGARVPVRTDGRRTIIGAAANTTYGDWKSLKEPPEPGIRDDQIKLGDGEALEVELLDVEQTVLMGMPMKNHDLLVRAGGQELRLSRQIVPPYARHLAVPGTRLPAVTRKGKVRIDWASAATRVAGRQNDEGGPGGPPSKGRY